MVYANRQVQVLIDALNTFEAELQTISSKWHQPLAFNLELLGKLKALPHKERLTTVKRYLQLKKLHEQTHVKLMMS